MFQEKFKREFQQRFPFRSRRWRSSTIESLESDKTLVAGRPSVRSTTTTVDWRTSTTTNRNSAYNRGTNGSYFSSRPHKKMHKSRDKDLYVLHSSRGRAVVHCPSESEYDELCLWIFLTFGINYYLPLIFLIKFFFCKLLTPFIICIILYRKYFYIFSHFCVNICIILNCYLNFFYCSFFCFITLFATFEWVLNRTHERKIV